MNKRISLSSLSNELLQVWTKKKAFLVQIERIMPWNEWLRTTPHKERACKRGEFQPDCACKIRRNSGAILRILQVLNGENSYCRRTRS